MTLTATINDRAIRVLIEDRAGQVIRKALPAIRLEMQRRFRLPKSGRIYSRGKAEGGGRVFRGGGRYRASARGEAPAIRSGRLFNSIRETYPKKTEGIITIDTPYAAYLEPPATLDRPFALVSAETIVERFNAPALNL